MTKIGKVKSWYIDPDDKKLTFSQHNIIFVANNGEDKVFTVRHDDVDSDDFDSAVETGKFELNGKSFNARFADIYGRMNYTNVTL